jgi:RimJ/RimL family protein N-acetyltransferase
LLLFVNFLFEEFGFIKIYSDVIDYNLDAFRSVVGRWMEHEGVLRDHERHRGRRWDLHILSLWRDRFERDRERLLDRVTHQLPQ